MRKIEDYLPQQRLVDPETFMERIIDTEQNVKIVTIADVHTKATMFNERFFQESIKKVKDNGSYVMGLGDFFENSILHFGKQDEVTGDYLLDYMADSLMPIADRFLAIIPGNHDERSMKKQPQIDMVRELASRLGIEHLYRPYGALVKLKLGKDFRHHRPLTYWIYGIHGCGGSRTEGGKMNALKRMSQNYVSCDLYLMGHHHWVMGNADSIFIPSENSKEKLVKKHTRKYALCGTFLDWGEYAEKAQFQMGAMVLPQIELDAKVKDVRITI